MIYGLTCPKKWLCPNEIPINSDLERTFTVSDENVTNGKLYLMVVSPLSFFP